MTDNHSFWDFYWETRLKPMENLGKRSAILEISRLIRMLAESLNRPLRMLELGCGEGQVIGQLLDAHSELCDIHASVGVDRDEQSLLRCKQDYPGSKWITGDFTDAILLGRQGKFDIVILVNALHEVFSDGYSVELGEIDTTLAKRQVEQAIGSAVGCLEPGGWLVLFDGLEPPGNPGQKMRIRFRDYQSREGFENFVEQFQPFNITYQDVNDPWCVELSQHDFTRYITKSIFLGKNLWKSERLQSYQYFTEEEYRASLTHLGLEIFGLTTLTMNEEKWAKLVELETPGAQFPDEHILILAQRTTKDNKNKRCIA